LISTRKTAAIVGLLFLAATFTFIVADVLIKGVLTRPNYLMGASADANALAAGALFAFVLGLAVVAIAVLLFPLLKRTSEPLALGYVGLRVGELVVTLIYVAAPLMVIVLGNGFRDGTVNASALQALSSLFQAQRGVSIVLLSLVTGVDGTILAFLLYRSKLIPRPLAVLGLIGYPVLFTGSVLAMFGATDVTQGAGLLSLVPGGFFELILPIWLLAKGFSHPVATAVESPDPIGRAPIAAFGPAPIAP
jgi:hypothetical protein